ncbi:MAG: ABC transporter ATP-binding protein [Propionibacteriaceae bacterium]|nr:ABC transporter ATP-binding protein [Propionibacteriaceae bacterium]
MIIFERVSLRYSADTPQVLSEIDLTIPDGQLVLVAGRTGSGKSSLLGLINGHVPHFTGGIVTGRISVDGHSTADHPPRDLAHLIGVVPQNPLAGFVTDTVEEELAYGMEQLALAPALMRTRVEETLDILGLANLRTRALRTLSGGEQQRVAIGSVLATGARTLVLDEPTSALDPVSSEEVLAALLRLVHDLGLTAVIAEHRLERVASYADRMILLDGQGGATEGPTRQVMATSPLVPPVVELGRIANFPQVVLSVREARAEAAPLRLRLADQNPDQFPRNPQAVRPQWPQKSTAPFAPEQSAPGMGADVVGQKLGRKNRGLPRLSREAAAFRRESERGDKIPQGSPRETPSEQQHRHPSPHQDLVAKHLRVTYGSIVAVKDISLTIPAGQVTVIMGRNGSGKSSLLWSLTGVQKLAGGRFSLGDQPLEALPASKIRNFVRLVPHTATDLLYLSSVAEECEAADHETKGCPGTCRQILDSLTVDIPGQAHPRDLSEGQKLALALAIQLTANPQVILLDEPTRGLDYPAKSALAQILATLAAQGRVVAVVTHDVEFAAGVADQIIVMATGEVIQAAAAGVVLGTSALFAPQVAKVLYPSRWLTPYQVGAGLTWSG